jgi:geranylgeranyl pyrophosphate synthase
MDSELVKTKYSKVYNQNNYLDFINDQLLKVINRHNFLCSKLFQAVNYSLFSGGKRIRPLLVFGAGECLGIAIEDLAIAACAVEFMHTYSLIHDDLPDMDNDTFRRGKKTCHIVYGTTTAILAGDALQCLAFEVISNSLLLPNSNLTSEQRLEMLKLLSSAAGVSGMVGGQSLEFSCDVNASFDISMLNAIYSGKTGALLQASIAMGMAQSSNLASPTEEESYIRNKLYSYSTKFGNLFQICDDIKDIEQDKQKDVAKVNCSQKYQANVSIIELLGVVKAKEYAFNLQQQALQDLQDIGSGTQLLRQITASLI